MQDAVIQNGSPQDDPQADGEVAVLGRAHDSSLRGLPTDLDATADFYTRVLGFRLVSDQRGAKDPYLALERDGVHIGAAARPDQGHRDQRRPPTGVELVLEVNDLDTEHRHVVASGWPLAADLQQRPWGQRDFRLLDPSGYYLRVTSRKVQA